MLWEFCPSQLLAVAKAWEAELWHAGERLRILKGLCCGPSRRAHWAGIPFASLRLRPFGA
jgi:hypothetical protein